jgi:hypothetical protein
VAFLFYRPIVVPLTMADLLRKGKGKITLDHFPIIFHGSN